MAATDAVKANEFVETVDSTDEMGFSGIENVSDAIADFRRKSRAKWGSKWDFKSGFLGVKKRLFGVPKRLFLRKNGANAVFAPLSS